MRVRPMLACDGPLPSGPDWIAEPKMDGWRACVCVTDGDVTVWSRHGTNLTARFPELAQLGELGDAILDGEVVVYGDDGLPDFRAVASRPGPDRKASLAVFDVLAAEGKRLGHLAYAQRRDRLEALTLPSVAAPVTVGPVDVLWEATEALGLEGVVCKRSSSAYRSGRSRSWVRAKHWKTTQYTVCAYATAPSGGLRAVYVDAGESRPKIELGLHRRPELLAQLTSAQTGSRRGITAVAPAVQVRVRHHGNERDPRDATLVE